MNRMNSPIRMTAALWAALALVSVAHAEDKDQPERSVPKLTEAQRSAAVQDARTFGTAQEGRTAMPNVQENVGEHGAGRIEFSYGRNAGYDHNGRWISSETYNERSDLNKLTPGGTLADRQRLEAVGSGAHDLQNLKAATADEEARLKQDKSTSGEAFRTAESTARREPAARDAINVNEFDPSRQALDSGRSGIADGEVFADCEETVTPVTVDVTDTAWDEFVCESLRYPNDDQVACTREYLRVPNMIILDQDKRALLNVGEDTEGEICRVSRNLSLNQTLTPFARVAELLMTTETGGWECTRRRVATARIEETPGEKTDSLGINNESGGTSYWIERRVRELSDLEAQSLNYTLGMDEQRAGLMCARQHWPSEGTSTVQEAMETALNVNMETHDELVCERWRTPSMGEDIQAGGFAAEIDLNTETNSLVCRRFIDPEASTGSESQTKDVTIDVDQESPGLVCRREVWPTHSTTPSIAQTDRTLSFDTQEPGNICRRTVWPENATTYPTGQQDSELLVDTQAQGQVCTRTVTPSQSTSTGNGSTEVFLPVDGQQGGNICTRQVWPTQSTTSPSYSMDTQIGIDSQTGGWVCDRWLWPTGGQAWIAQNQSAWLFFDGESSRTLCTKSRYEGAWGAWDSRPGGRQQTFSRSAFPGSHSVDTMSWWVEWGNKVQGPEFWSSSTSHPCWDVAVTQVPNGGDGTLSFQGVGPSYEPGVCTAPAPDAVVNHSWQWTHYALDYSDNQSGSCSTAGTTCPASWTCNGYFAGYNPPYVMTDEWSLENRYARLFPGASHLCSSATLRTTCTSTSESNSVALNVPAGTTGIRNFSWGVSNQHSGWSVSITQTPSSANGYVAIFTVTRTLFTTTPPQPQIWISYEAQVPSTSYSIQESGNCSDPGTANCPASFACTQNAPATVNGFSISTSTASAYNGYFSGLGSTCIRSQKNKSCGGTGTVGQTVNISSRLPPGTTTITGFSHQVLNPQSGVSVSLSSAPSQANGWIATFSVSRTNWGSVSNPQLRLTWQVPTTTTSISVTTNGNCATNGTPQCESLWTCPQRLPRTVNGVALTLSQTTSVAPLFTATAASSGVRANAQAPNDCVFATKDRICQGSAASSLNVNLSTNVAGQTNPTNFQHVVLNPQSGVTVSVAQYPTAGNGWVMRFTVTRSDFSYQPAQPRVRITWNHTVTTTTTSVVDAGACGDSGTANCAPVWSCPHRATYTVNGIPVTATMANARAYLYTGAPNDCVVAALSRVCSGSAWQDTSVSIQGSLPPGTTTIQNFGFSPLSNPGNVTISLRQTPTQANGWVAIFRTTRSNWASVPARPNVRMTWQVPTPVVNTSVREEGSCATNGTAQCPSLWTCPQTAPHTVNGINVDATRAAGEAPLYGANVASTGVAANSVAPNDCVIASKDRVCGGSANQANNISLAEDVAGQTNPRDFVATVLNPQTGVTVNVTQYPNAANSWVMIFNVARTIFDGSLQPPQVRISWTHDAASIASEVRETGDCGTPSTTNCPHRWTCAQTAPATINGITVTPEIADRHDPLFPAIAGQNAVAPAECAEAHLEDNCTGSAETVTTVSIGADLPAGTTTIVNFGFSVLNPQDDVLVELAQEPSEANGWQARFTVTRSSWESPGPDRPSLRLRWDAQYPTVSGSIAEVGNCGVAATAQCTVRWTCAETAPFELGGVEIPVSLAEDLAPLFPGISGENAEAPTNCVEGHLNRSCAGTSTTVSMISIASQIPAGTERIDNFAWVAVPANQAGVTIALTQTPALENGWEARFSVARDDYSYEPVRPLIQMTWNAAVPVVNFAVNESGNCLRAGSTFCPLNWSCTLQAEAEVDGLTITDAMVNTLPRLYEASAGLRHTASPMAPTDCLRGELRAQCTGAPSTDTVLTLPIPPGTTGISNLRWEPAREGAVPANVNISIEQEPTLQNGWEIVIRTTRTNWDPIALEPQIRLLWDRAFSVTEWTILESDPCDKTSGPTANCTPQWDCTQWPDPTVEINGITVDADMVAPLEALFDGARADCTRGERTMVCSGEATEDTEICIDTLLPSNTTQISDFGFSWLNRPGGPDPGIDVRLISEPVLGNGWCATFQVARRDFENPLPNPEIEVFWNAHTTSVEWSTVYEGSPNDLGSALCPTEWSCAVLAPQAAWPGPSEADPLLPVTAEDVMPLRPLLWDIDETNRAPEACLRAELNRVCMAEWHGEDTIDISSEVGLDATQIEDYMWEVINAQPGVTVTELFPPTLANGWIARFQVTRTDMSYTPVEPMLRLTWVVRETVYDVEQPDPEEGNCAADGSATCPTAWRCTQDAPWTLENGVTLETSMFEGLPPLFPALEGRNEAASPSCVIGELHRVCGGEDEGVLTSVEISDLIPEGVTDIEGFVWEWMNQDPRLRVELVEPPTEANGWVATFRVFRDFDAPPPGGKSVRAKNEDPPAPQIEVRWLVRGPLELEQDILTLSGDCSEDGSEECMATWVCDQEIPSTVPGVPTTIRTIAIGADGEPVVVSEENTSTDLSGLTPDDFAGLDFLSEGDAQDWFAANTDCYVVRKMRICQGDGSTLTYVSLADQIPEDVYAITDFSVEVLTPGVGVSFDPALDVVQVPEWTEDPETRWVAILRTTRTDWALTPTRPEVILRWKLTVERVEPEIVETGDCGLESTPFCNLSWTCTAFAEGYGPDSELPPDNVPLPGGDNGVIVETSATVFGSFSPGEVDDYHEISIAGRVAPGMSTVTGLRVDVVDGPYSVAVVQDPTADNGWTVGITLIRGPGEQGGARVVLRLMWINADQPPPPDPESPIQGWELIGIPPIWGGEDDPEEWGQAPLGCIRAERRWDCSPINDGSICNDSGRACEDLDGREIDTCGEYENASNCSLSRSSCTVGSSYDGHCYVESHVYRCSREVAGQETILETTRNCQGAAVTCLEGECQPLNMQDDRDQSDNRKRTYATWAMMQAVQTDYVDENNASPDEGTPPPGCEDCVWREKVAPRKQGTGSVQKGTGEVDPDRPAGIPGSPEDPYDPFEAPNDPVPDVPHNMSPYAPPGFSPDAFKMFEGHEYNCMKAVGGLLNCCKQPIQEEVKGEWWQIFLEHMRQSAAETQSCEATAIDPLSGEQDLTGNWDQLGAGMDIRQMMRSWTSTHDTASGAGEQLACSSEQGQRMDAVHQQFLGRVHTEYKPRLNSLYCDDDEVELAAQNKAGACYFLGAYCQSEILGICLDKRDRYCCFKSPMSKMLRVSMHEQGVITMGTAEDPQCDGISVSQMQSLFSGLGDTGNAGGMWDDLIGELESEMLDAGVLPDLAAMDFSGLEERLTGDGSLVANPERLNLTERTNQYIQDADLDGALGSADQSTRHLMPTEAMDSEEGPAKITLSQAMPVFKRGSGMQSLEVVKTGGDSNFNEVLVSWVPVNGITDGHDMQIHTYRLTFPAGNGRVVRHINMSFYDRHPPATTNAEFEIHLSVVAGNGQVWPRSQARVTVTPAR